MKFGKKIKFISLLFLFLCINSFFIERYVVRFPEYEFYSERIPKEFDGFKIAVVTDLHYGFLNPEFWIQRLVLKTNDLNPDVIVGLGDYVKKRNRDIELLAVWPFLNQFSAKEQVLFVNGNHDHWANHKLSLKLLEESGKSARNKEILIRRKNKEIAFVGLGDFWEDHFEIDSVNLSKADNIFRIILAHNPDSSNTNHNTKVDLFLTGHTHGGQIRIPFFEYSPVLPVTDKLLDKGFKKNRFGEDVFISSGIGWSIIPVRFYCPAEIPIIVLRSKN
ncbi:metallophosphoesterase [Leptospira perdikensis]|uniref:Metallophosphoesterase n=1 Tax=Leptospira perdikensis TaxID=2484948 RepID=A0A4R9JHT9_9LEPT|nr:metallophosphoesterase [Leptospira perdikensis]TGL39815.1 metallophosphoesterase [Leptospira perdikensis]